MGRSKRFARHESSLRKTGIETKTGIESRTLNRILTEHEGPKLRFAHDWKPTLAERERGE